MVVEFEEFPFNSALVGLVSYTLDIQNPPVIPGQDRCERNL